MAHTDNQWQGGRTYKAGFNKYVRIMIAMFLVIYFIPSSVSVTSLPFVTTITKKTKMLLMY